MELFQKGKNQDWYSFKSALCEHMSCSSIRSGGQLHMSALQHKFQVERRALRNNSVIINIINAGIEVCKMKAAATHFESVITLLSICQADVGNLGHGRY